MQETFFNSKNLSRLFLLNSYVLLKVPNNGMDLTGKIYGCFFLEKMLVWLEAFYETWLSEEGIDFKIAFPLDDMGTYKLLYNIF